MASKAGSFDARGELELWLLIPYRPSPETLVSSIKALGQRLSGITDLPGDLTVEQGNPRIPGAEPSGTPEDGVR